MFFALGNYGRSFHHICGIMVHICLAWAELLAQILNQNGTSPSKTRLCYPPPPREHIKIVSSKVSKGNGCLKHASLVNFIIDGPL